MILPFIVTGITAGSIYGLAALGLEVLFLIRRSRKRAAAGREHS